MKKADQADIAELIQLACRLGASDASLIRASDISVEDDLANLCREPRCKNFGLSAQCPPHTPGPGGFRKMREGCERALFFKIDVPNEALFSSEGHEIFRLLHEIAAGIEQSAIRLGYSHSKAFAGGSCKKAFCGDYAECRVLSEKGDCRYPESARPSMSGFGIDVSKLMKLAGWTMSWSTMTDNAGLDSTGTVCGLILIA